MNIQKQIVKDLKALEHYEATHRSGIVRLTALALTATTLFHMSGLNQDVEKSARYAITQKVPVFNTAEKNETVRMPIRFDDGLRATATTSA